MKQRRGKVNQQVNVGYICEQFLSKDDQIQLAQKKMKGGKGGKKPKGGTERRTGNMTGDSFNR